MELCLVRNSNSDSLFLFDGIKPIKEWSSNCTWDIKLNPEVFLEVNWDEDNSPVEVKLVPISVFEESKSLYNEINEMINRLVSARLSDDEDSKRLAINELERCSVNTLQHLSYLISYSK